MKLIPLIAAILCCVLLTLSFTHAQEVPQPAPYTLKIRVAQDGKDTFTQEIQLQAQSAFNVATTVGDANFALHGSGQMEQGNMVVRLTFDCSRSTDDNNARTAARASVNTTLTTQPDGRESKIGGLTTSTNNGTQTQVIWVSVRKTG